ncbi:hypothetical protein [Kamptonema formosum]|uniref:hypothetical protein n=1 Tax=Kamptonema formosum TaxID=331992 RepID=UPI00036DC283|nr:hypothetical protein [Oscillatoria sp. PCC 10802]
MFKYNNIGPLRHRKIYNAPAHPVGFTLIDMTELSPPGFVILFGFGNDSGFSTLSCHLTQTALPAA